MSIKRLLRRIFIDRDLAVVRSDGGICSQMLFRAVAEELRQRGYCVKRDLTWYRRSGRDCLGRPNRNYQIDELCPSLALPMASEREICRLLAAGLSVDLSEPGCLEAPRVPGYFCGYSNRSYFIRHRKLFADAMSPFLPSEKGLESWIDLLKANGCAVHVRRGDLSGVTDLTPVGACGVGYFVDAARHVQTCGHVSNFILFSDDVSYARERVLPALANLDADIRVCDVNDQQHGYLDLFLMSRAPWIIGSEGSASVYARALSADASVGGLVLPRNGRMSNVDYGTALGRIVTLEDSRERRS